MLHHKLLLLGDLLPDDGEQRQMGEGQVQVERAKAHVHAQHDREHGAQRRERPLEHQIQLEALEGELVVRNSALLSRAAERLSVVVNHPPSLVETIVDEHLDMLEAQPQPVAPSEVRQLRA